MRVTRIARLKKVKRREIRVSEKIYVETLCVQNEMVDVGSRTAGTWRASR